MVSGGGAVKQGRGSLCELLLGRGLAGGAKLRLQKKLSIKRNPAKSAVQKATYAASQGLRV